MVTNATFWFCLLAIATTTSCYQEMEVLQMAKNKVSQAMNWVEYSVRLDSLLDETTVALRDCAKLYGESESRISHMMSDKDAYTKEDAITWLSAVMTNHRTCLDGLEEKGYVEAQGFGKNLSMLLGEALVLFAKNKGKVIGKFQKILFNWSCLACILVSRKFCVHSAIALNVKLMRWVLGAFYQRCSPC